MTTSNRPTPSVETSHNVYRKATSDEIDAARKMGKQLGDLQAKINAATKEKETLKASCQHKVFIDEPTYMYTYRSCFACGKLLEEI